MKSFDACCDDVFRKLEKKTLDHLGCVFFYKDFLINLPQGVFRECLVFLGGCGVVFCWWQGWVCDFKEALLATSGHISPLCV